MLSLAASIACLALALALGGGGGASADSGVDVVGGTRQSKSSKELAALFSGANLFPYLQGACTRECTYGIPRASDWTALTTARRSSAWRPAGERSRSATSSSTMTTPTNTTTTTTPTATPICRVSTATSSRGSPAAAGSTAARTQTPPPASPRRARSEYVKEDSQCVPTKLF